jgi:argininosuccinate lyase
MRVLEDMLALMAELFGGITVNQEFLAARVNAESFFSVDVLDYLVKKGVPFRQAHELVGKAVAEAIRSRTPLDQLDLAAIDPAFGPEAKEVFSVERALAARTNAGSPSITNVKAEIARWKADCVPD